MSDSLTLIVQPTDTVEDTLLGIGRLLDSFYGEHGGAMKVTISGASEEEMKNGR